jgi:hypothetical protein
MIWLTWRQFRIQALTGLALLAAAAIPFAVTGTRLAQLYQTSGLPGCATECAPAQAAFAASLKADATYPVLFFVAVAILYLAPTLIGMFWGAPLIARELEAGTLRIVWTQSVNRTRWLAVKLGLVGLAAVVTTALLSLAVTWWSAPIDDANARPGQSVYSGFPNRFSPVVFSARDLVPAAYAAFAFTLGVAIGVLARRTLPALALTLAVLASVQILVPVVLRAHYRQPEQTTTAITIAPDGPFKLRLGGATMAITVPVNIPGGWVTSLRTTDASGHTATPLTPPACQDPTAPPAACDDAINQLQLTEVVSYQPADRFWAFQWYEAGGYLVATLILAGLCLLLVRRLRPL